MAGSAEGRRRVPGAVLIVAVLAVLLAAGWLLGRAGPEAGAGGIFRASWWRWAAGCLAAGRVGRYEPPAGDEPGEAAAVLALLGLGGALGALLWASRRRLPQVAAVAGTVFREAWRGGALPATVLAGLALAVLAPRLEHEGGPAERFKIMLAMCGGAAVLAGTFLAVVASALTFARESETRSIQVSAVKPAPRWAFFCGKLWGMGLVLAAALAAAGAGTAAAVRIAAAQESARLRASGGDAGAVRRSLRFWRERFPDEPSATDVGGGPARAGSVAALRPGQSLEQVIRVSRAEAAGGELLLRIHARPSVMYVTAAAASLEVGGRSYPVRIPRSGLAELAVPAAAASGGVLKATLRPAANYDGSVGTLEVPVRGAVALACGSDSLEAALLKGLAAVWMQLMVVAAVTLAAAGVLSFPVATVAGLVTALAGHLSGLAGAFLSGPAAPLGQAGGAAGAAAGAGAANALVRQWVSGMIGLFPDFERTSCSEFMGRGDAAPWSFLAAAVLGLLVLRMAPAALAGCAAFARREAGR